ncbi:hypothetical protein B0H17DRAFT_1051096 [Mycena rosella]|uniref:CCHC-type domain-containing protein n=1 Tax=Mycena rosella TaxID=1033263 RepID=A0AAD7GJL2_MYCRO|nr:hypothetical protein B0H17DRAFT_1051096 [Mycena rosella]
MKRTCYRCGSADHLAAQCSEPWKDTPKECYNCGSSAHLVADCTEQWTPAPKRQSGHKVPSANE